MVDDREHERYRFDRMSTRQLWTRLGRITKGTKLLYFAREAADRGLTSLARSALKKYRDKTGVNVDAPWVRRLDIDSPLRAPDEKAMEYRAKAKAKKHKKLKEIRKIRV